MTILRLLKIRGRFLPVLCTLLLAFILACSSAVRSTPESTPMAPAPLPANTGPDLSLVPSVNLSRNSVPLEDVVFDTFDGGFVRLSDAEFLQIEELRDVIKPIYAPGYGDIDALPWLGDSDDVIGYESKTGALAYPIRILNFYELVNDVIDEVPVLISYCPLCASGVVSSREVDGKTLLFGNTSALFESNLVMHDHQTGSYWFQVIGEAIVGDLAGKTLSLLPSVTMSWGEWKARHPDTRLLTGSRTDYRDFTRFSPNPLEEITGAGLFETVLEQGRVPFPVSEEKLDGRLRVSERVLTVEIGTSAKAYPVVIIGDAVVNEVVGGEPIVVFSRGIKRTGVAFDPRVNGKTLTFRYEDEGITDEETGSTWSTGGCGHWR